MWQVFFPVEAETGTVGLPFFCPSGSGCILLPVPGKIASGKHTKKKEKRLGFRSLAQGGRIKSVRNSQLFDF